MIIASNSVGSIERMLLLDPTAHIYIGLKAVVPGWFKPRKPATVLVVNCRVLRPNNFTGTSANPNLLWGHIYDCYVRRPTPAPA